MKLNPPLSKAFFIIAAIATVSTAMHAPPVRADWDYAGEAREAAARKKAAAETAKRNAEASAKRAEAMRKTLAGAPYNESAAKLAAMNESELKALHNRHVQQINERNLARSAQGVEEFSKAMKNLTPEQRAMLEKQSGMKIDELMKQARDSTAKK